MNLFNCGVYEINFQGNSDAEFKGIHPAVVIKTLTEPRMLYVIPMTTYTEDRWRRLKENYCCKISSANSIARIDKMIIMNEADISHRYIKNGKYIVPTYDEMVKLQEKLVKYFTLSTEKALNRYNKFYSEYILFATEWEMFLLSGSVEGTNFVVINEEPLILQYPLEGIQKISYEDMKYLLKNGTYHCSVTYNKDENNLQIKLSERS